MLGLGSRVVSQTLSGYSDSDPAVASKRVASAKPMKLEYPGVAFEGLQATLQLSTNTFQFGGNIEVQIVIKNVSTNQVAISTAWPLLANGFNIQVMDKDKVEVPLTSLGESQRASGAASPNISRNLLPNETVVFTIDLQKIYQIRAPGTFTIQASRLLPFKNKAGNLQIETGVAQITLVSAMSTKTR